MALRGSDQCFAGLAGVNRVGWSANGTPRYLSTRTVDEGRDVMVPTITPESIVAVGARLDGDEDAKPPTALARANNSRYDIPAPDKESQKSVPAAPSRPRESQFFKQNASLSISARPGHGVELVRLGYLKTCSQDGGLRQNTGHEVVPLYAAVTLYSVRDIVRSGYLLLG